MEWIKQYSRSRSPQSTRTLFALLLIAAAAARLFGCWCYRYACNVDHAVIAMMVRHMASGQGFPLFFYGQSYMGSLEQLFSVPVQLIAPSLLSLSIGAPIVGLLGVWAVYSLTRKLSGPFAAICATLYCVIGPKGYLHYQCSPRSYTPILLISLLLLDRGAASLRHRDEQDGWRPLDLFVMGVLVGLGWWASALTMNATVTVVLVLLLFGGWRLILAPGAIMAGVGGTVLGAAPWLVWNLANGWRSLAAAQSFESVRGISRGLALFFGDRMSRILQVATLPSPFRQLTALLYIAAFLALIAFLIYLLATRDKRRYLATALLLFIPISGLLYSLTEFQHFNTARYNLPMVPIAAIALGVLMNAIARKTNKWVALIPMLFIVLSFSLNLKGVWQRQGREAETAKHAQALIDTLRAESIPIAYADHMQRWFNVLSKDNPIFVSIRNLRYRPHGEAAERADSPAFINDMMGISDFLATTQGTAEQIGDYTCHALVHVKRVAQPLKTIPRTAIASITTPHASVKPRLFDHILDTGVELSGKTFDLIITLDAPTRITSLRLWMPEKIRTCRWQLFYQADASQAWTPLFAPLKTTPYRWSGPRVYPQRLADTLETRFAPVIAKRVRIRFTAKRKLSAFLGECSLYAPEAAPASPTDRQTVAEAIERNGIERLYAERWESVQLEPLLTHCDVVSQAGLTRSERKARPDRVDGAGKRSAILIPQHDADASRETLDYLRIPFTEVPLGHNRLFTLQETESALPIVWHAGRLLFENRWRLADALEKIPTTNENERIAFLYKACELDPGRRDLYAALKQAVGPVPADPSPWLAPFSCTPQAACEVPYKNGATLIGATWVTSGPFQPGTAATLNTHWILSEAIKARSLALFVHIRKDGDIAFQADHGWLPAQPVDDAPHPERVLLDTTTIQIPCDAVPGTYTIHVGLVDPLSRQRIAHDGFFKRFARTELPVTLTIETKRQDTHQK